MESRGRVHGIGFSLAEVMLALCVVSIAILGVAPLTAKLARSTYQGDTSQVQLFLAASRVVEEIRAVNLASSQGYASLSQMDGKTWGFDRNGNSVAAQAAEIACVAHVGAPADMPECGTNVMRVVVMASRPAYPQDRYELATLLAPGPPRSHMIISGFIEQPSSKAIYGDDYWGGYYGALFGKMQAQAYRRKDVNPNHYPFPADPDQTIEPPVDPSRLPWGWQ